MHSISFYEWSGSGSERKLQVRRHKSRSPIILAGQANTKRGFRMLKEINLIKVIKRRALGCRSDLANLPRRLIIWPERLTDLATVPCHNELIEIKSRQAFLI